MSQRRNQFEMYYHRIEKLLGRDLQELQPCDLFRLQASGFMDLVVEVLLPCDQTGATVISLCHYFSQNGDLCKDPDMTVRLFAPDADAAPEFLPSSGPEHGRAEALTFEQSIPPIYKEVYPEPGKYSPRLYKELNDFLGLWLRNLEDQGHKVVEVRRGDAE